MIIKFNAQSKIKNIKAVHMKYLKNILKFFIYKRRRSRPPQEHIKLIQYFVIKVCHQYEGRMMQPLYKKV
jgi:hypothetical protein